MNLRLAAFLVALLVQAGLLGSMAASRAPALIFGETVMLRIAPYDPYSVLAGYYATVEYEIARAGDWDRLGLRDGATVYAVLRPGPDGVHAAETFSAEWPAVIPDDAVVIRGHRYRGRILYGIETYFVPEDKREAVETDLRRAVNEAYAEVRIDANGAAAIVALHLAGTVY